MLLRRKRFLTIVLFLLAVIIIGLYMIALIITQPFTTLPHPVNTYLRTTNAAVENALMETSIAITLRAQCSSKPCQMP